jgi:hypothetical protein
MSLSMRNTGRRRPAVAFVFIAVMLDMIALGITAPVLPGLITRLLHGDAARAAGYFGGSLRRSSARCPTGSAAGRCCWRPCSVRPLTMW